MSNKISQWIKGEQKDGKKEKEVTLEDVTPLHPNEYPAKHLKEILDSRREEISDIEGTNHSSEIGHGIGGT